MDSGALGPQGEVDSPETRRVLGYVMRQPVRFVDSLAKALALPPLAVADCLGRLESAGLVEWMEVGGCRFVAATPEAEGVADRLLAPSRQEGGSCAEVEAAGSQSNRPFESHMVQAIRSRAVARGLADDGQGDSRVQAEPE